MKAITYDPVNDIFYFTDRKHPNTSVFSLKVRDDTTFLTTPLVPRSANESIEDLVYDFHDKALYWSDSGNKKIVKLVFDRSKNLKWSKETFLNVSGDVSGLEIDNCQRNLYYTIVTEGEPSINVVSLDTKDAKPTSFGSSENHFKPVAIAMDHQGRRLYVADIKKYNSYSIDSVSASGANFRTEVERVSKTPRSIAVDKNYVYYIEGNNNELRRFIKESGKNDSELFKQMQSDPSDIIVRGNFMTDLDAAVCKIPTNKIKDVRKEIEEIAQKKEITMKMCLHGGSLDKTSSSCMCTENFDGDFCEINLCYNFCLNGGDCSMSQNDNLMKLEPVCSCKKGFVGEHCEVDVCDNFCLNSGKCSLTVFKAPKCACSGKFAGSRCETSKDETSQPATQVIIGSRDDVMTSTTEAIVSESPERDVESPTDNLLGKPEDTVNAELRCEQNRNVTFAILAVCFTISLLIFLVILTVIKKIHRPLRPKIRKKYVVHKNMDQSLTYRPTTEQCEVIIEDCCNMNICETVSKS